ncbi:TPA: hypothetical protein KDY05_002000 [Vibrio parahaemolyticus]|nr:hypothetical protein [Vibrio parahaemolyticus]
MQILKFRPLTFGYSFILATTIFNFITYDMAMHWQTIAGGIVCGLPIVTAFIHSRKMALVLWVTSLAIFAFILSGYIDNFQVNRLFFIAMTAGVLLGFIPAYKFNKPKSYLFFASCLKMDGFDEKAEQLMARYRGE